MTLLQCHHQANMNQIKCESNMKSAHLQSRVKLLNKENRKLQTNLGIKLYAHKAVTNQFTQSIRKLETKNKRLSDEIHKKCNYQEITE